MLMPMTTSMLPMVFIELFHVQEHEHEHFHARLTASVTEREVDSYGHGDVAGATDDDVADNDSHLCHVAVTVAYMYVHATALVVHETRVSAAVLAGCAHR